MIRLIGFCLLAAVMTMLLRQMNPGVAALLCVAFGAMTLLTLLPAVGEYVTQIQAFLATLALGAVYGQLDAAGDGHCVDHAVAAQVCRDMDAPSIACRAELCGRLLLLGVALPIFLKLTQMAVGARNETVFGAFSSDRVDSACLHGRERGEAGSGGH